MQENNAPVPAAVPHPSESFGKIPHDAESFGSLPNVSESFRTVPKDSERKENHTLTVREVARLFEAAGVARTERSITNWCQPNRSGIARLDAYFDPNERRYFITPQSAESAIEEEKAKMVKGVEPSEPVGSVPKASESPEAPLPKGSEADSGRVRMLEQEVMDLKITNKGKDYFIEQLQKERTDFEHERQDYVEKLVSASRKVGELETRLLQLEAPKNSEPAQAGL
jgi:hypothetical protein